MKRLVLALLTCASAARLGAQPAPGCPEWRDDPRLLARLEETLADEIDAARREAQVPPLRREPRLEDVAGRFAGHLATLGVMAHQTEQTGTVQDRLRAASLLDWDAVGENLAVGTSINYVARPDDPRRETVACHTPESLAREISRAWRASPGHNRTLLDPRFNALGGAAVLDAAGRRVYVVHDFARMVTCGYLGAACCAPPEGVPGAICQTPLHCRAGSCVKAEPPSPAPAP